MLSKLHKDFKILAAKDGAKPEDIEVLKERFPNVPAEYVELVLEATDVEMNWNQEQYIRIYGPRTCLEMDEGYEFSQYIEEAIVIGDNGGGGALVYMDGKKGWGLYRLGYGAIDRDIAIWIASSLSAFLLEGQGIEFTGELKAHWFNPDGSVD